jgi:hypothetical protein
MPTADQGAATIRRLIAFILAVTLWHLAVAWLLPVTQDEAYYFDWARTLSWGYFDHPPGVALLGVTGRLAPGSVLAARLGTVAAATLTLIVLAAFYRRCGLQQGSGPLIALVLVATTAPGLAGGILTTPDTGLALCWALGLHEALAALQGDRRRWLGAGLATGLGLLSKYHMILIGPVFLWALVRSDPKALRTPWPYLGGLLALLVFAPHLLWGADNDWITMRFQFGHGFATETGPLVTSPLPGAVRPDAATLAEGTLTLGARVGGVLTYLGTQIALWGLLLVPVAAGLILGYNPTTIEPEAQSQPPISPESPELDPVALPLLWAGALFPLVFFAWIASLSAPEANWPIVYLLCAAPLAAAALRPVRTWVWVAAVANVALLTLYAVHAATAALPLGEGTDRILRETHGYPELARRVDALDGPVFAGGYQIAAMLRFYQPRSTLTQWPGVTRPSEYLRGVIAPTPTLGNLTTTGGFWLVQRRANPAEIPGFTPKETRVLIDCKGAGLVETTPGSAQEANPPCRRPLHVWQLVRYDLASGLERLPTTTP